jgi:hypothetical protein
MTTNGRKRQPLPQLRRILPKTPQTRQVQFRVSEDEYREILKGLRKSSWHTLSDYIRGKVLGPEPVEVKA